jgi:ElaB/YqjD/DUF883 family membrane-anchored ribosome-binding protein
MTNARSTNQQAEPSHDEAVAEEAATNRDELHRLREKLRANGAQLEADLRDAGTRFSEGAKKFGDALAEQVREHPMAAFGIAFAAGVVFSRWLRGR